MVDSSTISPSATRKFAERVRAKGAEYVDAPVTGSKTGGGKRHPDFHRGRRRTAIEKLKPLFAAMGKNFSAWERPAKGRPPRWR